MGQGTLGRETLRQIVLTKGLVQLGEDAGVNTFQDGPKPSLGGLGEDLLKGLSHGASNRPGGISLLCSPLCNDRGKCIIGDLVIW